VITALRTDRGLALQDLLAGTFEYIGTIEFPPSARVYLLDQLATTESAVILHLVPPHVAHAMTDIGYPLVQVKDSK
jgi:hypothetical protein